VAIRHRPRSTRLLVVTLVSISLAIITLDYRGGTTGPLASLGRTAKAGIAPLQEAVTRLTQPVANFFIGLANLPSLAEENRKLKEELAEARTLAARSEVTATQLDELEGLVGLQELHPDGITALVTANGISNFDWSITINRGSDAGVEPNMPVIAGTADAPRLVGRVIDVTPISAEVQLVLDRDHAVWAEVAGTRATGLVWGRGDQDLLMEVDPDVEVEGDEGVFTQGYSFNGQPGVYPSGLLIGQVARVSPEANSLTTPVEIRPAVDFSTLQFVLVLQVRGVGSEAGSGTAVP
jgi:rod shape-determining protein MreC